MTLEDVAASPGYVAMPMVREELVQEGLDPLITSDQFERVLVTRFGRQENAKEKETAIEYLVGVYVRLMAHRRRLLALSTDPEDAQKVVERVEIVDKAKEVLLRWAGLVVDPQMQGDMIVQNQRWVWEVCLRLRRC